MSKWIAEFELEDGDTMPEHMDLNYMGAKIDFHCRPMWISVSERLPEIDEDGYSSYVLVSFSNFTLPCIGQLRKTDGENHWYEEDDEKALDSFGLHVNAWMPLPNPYKAESEDKE